MAQRRKKITPFQNQKLAKAHHKKEFIRKLKRIINSINGEEVCSRLPQLVFDNLYNIRTHTFRLSTLEKHVVPSWIISQSKQTISDWTRIIKVDLIPGKLEVTIDEFFTVALTAILNLERFLTNEEDPSILELRDRMKAFNDGLEDIYHLAMKHIYDILLALAFYYSDIGGTIHWFDHDMLPTPNLERGIENIITIHPFQIETISVDIEKGSRPVKRLGYAFPLHGIDWISLKPTQIGINNSFSDIPLEVYIQDHALRRLSERIDCFLTGALHFHLFLSFHEPKVFYNKNKDTLIEFRFFGTKAGYFLIDMVEGKIIIRTFLFVTNNGTPEGEKLAKITGLQKLDKKYLAIDKLSTFMSSGISENEEVRKIFISADCQCLFDLYENRNDISTKSPKEMDASILLKYLGYNKEYIPESKQKEARLKR